MPKNPNINYDWAAIKSEYITNPNSSYRTLGKKYGVAYTSVCERSKKEGWLNAREQYQNGVVTRTVDQTAKNEVNRAVRLLTVSDKLLRRVERLLEDDEATIPPSQLESIAKTLKSIRDIQDGDKDKSNVKIEVVFGDGTEDFAQ